jgi:hypothetical protein
MASKLHSKLISGTKEFSLQSKKDIKKTKPVEIPGSKNRAINVTPKKIKTALNVICPQRNSPNGEAGIVNDFIKHFENLEKYIPFCSSPKSFRTAWGLRSNILNKYDGDVLANEGGQLIPVNKESRVFQCVQQGVELGIKKRLITAVRHSEGNFDDDLDDMGRFEYQPPADVTGMLRYRWCQFLSKNLETPYILIAVMWFEYRINESMNHVFIISPAKIIEEKKDLNDFGKSIHRPLILQIINRDEALNSINRIYSLGYSDIELETRAPLSNLLAREWAYDKIHTSTKGRQIKKWAKVMHETCPGESCNHSLFDSLNLNQIAFGHIIPQDWAHSFTYILDKKNHPDNLYLTCNKCNSSLSNNFPGLKLRKEINKRGTIGDWLRKAEENIRKL